MVRSGDRSMTYAELNRRANELAYHLRDLGVEPDQIVGGPDWMNEERFTIEATAGRPVTMAELQRMVRQLLVPGHDPDDYARVLADLLGNDLMRRSLARGAVAHAARFGWGAMAAGMLDVYADVLTERAAPAALVVNR
mgnify:CR=1 FL=1